MFFQSSMFQSASRDSSMGRYCSSREICAHSRSAAAGTWAARERTASAMPGPMTLEASTSTPMTARSVMSRAMGRRPLTCFPGRTGKSRRSMARMGTLRMNAMAPPSKNGPRIPSTQPTAIATAGRFCRRL